MTDPSYTHIAFLLDRSGSMQRIKADTEGGFDAFIAEQRKQSGRCTVTLAQFDTEYEIVHAAVDLAAVGPLALAPRGSTALLDSIGRLVVETGEFLARLPEAERPGTVIVGIMTDGLENASREWTRPAVKSLIEEQEATYGWTFSYMGANQDAIEVGTGLGVSAERSLTYGTAPGQAAAAFAAYADASVALRRSMASGQSLPAARAAAAYTPAQRAAAGGAEVGAPRRARRVGPARD